MSQAKYAQRSISFHVHPCSFHILSKYCFFFFVDAAFLHIYMDFCLQEKKSARPLLKLSSSTIVCRVFAYTFFFFLPISS